MSDPSMSEYDIKPAIITNGMKLAMTFIDRVGFPILAFMLIWWNNRELQKTIEVLNATLIQQTEIIRRIEYKLNK